MLRIISAFVETPHYVAAAALVVFVAVFWFALNHQQSLLRVSIRTPCRVCCRTDLRHPDCADDGRQFWNRYVDFGLLLSCYVFSYMKFTLTSMSGPYRTRKNRERY
jgi:hypothetical protein